jgi:hypothetical protein
MVACNASPHFFAERFDAKGDHRFHGSTNVRHYTAQKRSADFLFGVRPREPATAQPGAFLCADRALAGQGGTGARPPRRRGPHRSAKRNPQHHQPLFVTVESTVAPIPFPSSDIRTLRRKPSIHLKSVPRGRPQRGLSSEEGRAPCRRQ